MKNNWVPASAASLVTGAIALLLGALLIPTVGENAADTLMVVRKQDGRWLGAAVLFLLGGAGIMIGLPSLLGLFPSRGRRLGLTALAVMALAGAGTVGYAMLLVFCALVRAEAIVVTRFEDVTDDLGLTVFLYVWIFSFYVGELLLGLAVLRARSAPRWIPVLFLVHVALFPVADMLPEDLQSATTLLVSVALCGLAITANNQPEQLFGSTAPSGSKPRLGLPRRV